MPDEDFSEQNPASCECKKGAPLWMATFADMATLLMAFFVLILSFSEMNVLKYKQLAGSMTSAFGVQREVHVLDPPKGTSVIKQEFSPSIAAPTVINNVRQQTDDSSDPELEVKDQTKQADFDVNSEYRQLEQVLSKEIARGQIEVKIEDNYLLVDIKGRSSTAAKNEAEGADDQGRLVDQAQIELFAKIAEAQSKTQAEVKVREQVAAAQQQGGEEIAEQLRELNMELASEIEAGLAEVEQQGDKVIVRLSEQGAFPSGGAELALSSMGMLRRVSAVIAKNTGTVTVAGHTDNRPILFNDKYPSNWDLSAARAAAVADAFSTLMGVPRSRLNIEGHADTKPLVDFSTRANRARNRRIEIIMEVQEP